MPFGSGMNLFASTVITICALLLLFKGRSTPARFLISACALGILALLAIGLANPNVVSLETGLLGLRKSGTVLLGILIGLFYQNRPNQVFQVAWWLLILSCVGSLFLHLTMPSVEMSIVRGADAYTSLFGGEARLQGLFPGPFHASMASAFLILLSMPDIEAELTMFQKVVGFLAGTWTLFETEVRTGFVVVAVGAIAHFVLSSKARNWFRLLILIPLMALFALAFSPEVRSILPNSAALTSLLSNPLDSRFTYRFTTWEQAWDMIQSKPFLGWGPGSAGDTMGWRFPLGGHVTSHNMFLKYFVEGGALAGFFFILMLLLLAYLIFQSNHSLIGTQALLVILLFGMTGSSVEALPVSFLLAVIIGLAASGASKFPGPKPATTVMAR